MSSRQFFYSRDVRYCVLFSAVLFVCRYYSLRKKQVGSSKLIGKNSLQSFFSYYDFLLPTPPSSDRFGLCIGSNWVTATEEQCSGSVGTVSVWVFRIRYLEVRIRILLSSSQKKQEKPWCPFVCDFLITLNL
jgi:hypothetical protein